MSTLPAQLDPDIQSLLERLRRRIRLYVWVEGVAATLAVLGLAFWLGLALDWLLEPSPLVRSAALLLVAVLTLGVIYRYILARAFVRLSDSNMALLLEKHAARFDDSLLTSVQLAELPAHAEPYNSEMLSHTSQQARLHLPEARLGKVFNHGPLVRKLAAAAVLLASIGLFGYWASESLAFFVGQRVMSLTEVRWPRYTRLLVEGFPADDAGRRTMKVARGGSFDLQIRADNSLPTPPPERVEIRYALDDGSRGRGDARRIGEAIPGRDEYQEYIYSFKDLFHSQTFDVLGGDDGITDLRIEVVDSPEITSMVLHCEYPSYMNHAPRDLNVTGAMAIPRGATLTLRATANKDLVHVQVIDPDANELVRIEIAEQRDRKQFEYAIPTLSDDRLLLFVLHDHDGIENLEPYRLALSAMPDEAPQVTVALRGIGSAITPDASIPVVGAVADDYGLAEVWFEHRVGETEPQRTPVAAAAAGASESPIDAQLDARPLQLEPEQKLLLAVKAIDRYDLGELPNEGSSQRFLLDVVTPDQLRVMLESRELMLRRRFETIYAELIETRDLIARIDFSPAEPAESAKIEEEAAEAGEAELESDSPADEESRSLARRQVRIVRSLQNVQRSAHETLAVATAFDEIYEEMVNNRIDSEDLQRRLIETIAVPLKEIGGPRITELEQTLETLKTQAGNQQAGGATQGVAVAQADAVLVEMKAVLDRMLELESYNEVMELLRAIISEQEQLNQQTDQQRKDKLKDLLED